MTPVGILKRRFTQTNRPPQDTSWCWLTAEMLDSAAWRVLTGNAMKVVLRIALEHLRHGGVENGLLPVTYQDFVRWGVRRNAIREAILVAINLGWIDKTSTGEVPWHGDIRKPSTFALTWLPQHNGAPASNRWTRIKCDADAKAAIRASKAELAQLRRLPAFFNRQKKPRPTPKSVTWSGDGSNTCLGGDSLSDESNSPQCTSNDSDTPFYISASSRRGRPAHPSGDVDPSARIDPREPEQPDGARSVRLSRSGQKARADDG
jgi:hypothetical protein